MRGTGTDEAQPAGAVEELRADPSSRKRFLQAAGGAGVAAALSALLAACGGDDDPEPTPGGSNPNTAAGQGTDGFGPGDLGIVRYALLLEYLEADFYAAAGDSGVLSGRAGELAQRFGQQEREHVTALEDAVRTLGGDPPDRIDAPFPLGSRQEALDFALGLESLGASAYLAQAPRIQDRELLATALTIHSVEGRHAAAIATLLGQEPAPQTFALPTQAGDVLGQIQRITSGNAT
jgi:Ferritin-like domain